MAALGRGEKKSHVSAMFSVSRDTIDRWLKRRAAIGSVQAVAGYQRGHSHCIKDWEAFRAFAFQHGDKTQAAMAQHWQGVVSPRTMARALAQIDWTRTKSRMATANGMPPNVPLAKRH